MQALAHYSKCDLRMDEPNEGSFPHVQRFNEELCPSVSDVEVRREPAIRTSGAAQGGHRQVPITGI